MGMGTKSRAMYREVYYSLVGRYKIAFFSTQWLNIK
jgi:hypothetical protein